MTGKKPTKLEKPKGTVRESALGDSTLQYQLSRRGKPSKQESRHYQLDSRIASPKYDKEGKILFYDVYEYYGNGQLRTSRRHSRPEIFDEEKWSFLFKSFSSYKDFRLPIDPIQSKIRKLYYNNGQVESKTTYIYELTYHHDDMYGKRVGPFISYYEDGVVKEQGKFNKNEKRTGVWTGNREFGDEKRGWYKKYKDGDILDSIYGKDLVQENDQFNFYNEDGSVKK